MKSLAMAAIVLAVCATTTAAPIQWTAASGGNDHWYEVFTVQSPATSINWQAAKLDAISKNGYLATLTSAAENQWVYSTFNIGTDVSLWWLDPANNYQGPWIGGYQPNPGVGEPAGGWAWVTGETWSWAGWDPGEPNDFAGVEHYAQFFYDTLDGHEPVWNDAPNNAGVVAWVVEYDVPEPVTLSLLAVGGLGLLRNRRTRRATQ